MKSPFRLLLAALALAGTAGASALPPPNVRLPDTVEGRRMGALLAAFDEGTEPAIRGFIEKNFSRKDLERMPVEPRLQRLRRLAGQTGPLALRKILAPTPEGPAMLVQSKETGRWYQIRLELAPSPGREILGIDIDDSDASAMEPEPVFSSDAEVARAADAYLAKLLAQDRFSGVALMARGGKPFFESAYGFADRRGKIPNTTGTKFNIGSINKIFTQVAIAQLASEGRLSLSDTIRKYLPGDSLPAADRITILELCNMSSGLGDIFVPGYREAAPHLEKLSDFLPLFAGKPLLFAPGTSRRYSNAGYIVLGLIIEKVSGEDYHAYVRDHIFAPAGMGSSGPSVRSLREADIAIGYTRGGPESADDAPLHPNTETLPARSSSAGGGLSTARDLLAFDKALRSGALLPARWTAWIYSDKNGPPSPGADLPKAAGMGIAGGAPGLNAALESDGARDITVVVLANLDPPIAERTAVRLRRWLETEKKPSR
jgi:CubicO group peptidase (beta-lactamase class C family)